MANIMHVTAIWLIVVSSLRLRFCSWPALCDDRNLGLGTSSASWQHWVAKSSASTVIFGFCLYLCIWYVCVLLLVVLSRVICLEKLAFRPTFYVLCRTLRLTCSYSLTRWMFYTRTQTFLMVVYLSFSCCTDNCIWNRHFDWYFFCGELRCSNGVDSVYKRYIISDAVNLKCCHFLKSNN